MIGPSAAHDFSKSNNGSNKSNPETFKLSRSLNSPSRDQTLLHSRVAVVGFFIDEVSVYRSFYKHQALLVGHNKVVPNATDTQSLTFQRFDS